MKKSFLPISLACLVLFTACGQKQKNKNISTEDKIQISDQSIEDKNLSFEPYSGFSNPNQFEVSIRDMREIKFENITDPKMIENIKDKAEGKYVIYIDYVFEDKTIDNDFSNSSYKLQDILPSAFDSKDKELEFIFATNIVPEIDLIKSNQESIRAVFVSDQKVDFVKYKFSIKDNLDTYNDYVIKFEVEE
ncbi:MAG: hypothetical protein PUG67_01740 [Peptoniphilaceae bacterium]|nr:hypothetical protein [Peptoniphilaceae bacterium]MDY6019719.1 hypothetical protein [Anaerococcus sp.]